jgi:hypothetical protein
MPVLSLAQCVQQASSGLATRIQNSTGYYGGSYQTWGVADAVPCDHIESAANFLNASRQLAAASSTAPEALAALAEAAIQLGLAAASKHGRLGVVQQNAVAAACAALVGGQLINQLRAPEDLIERYIANEHCRRIPQLAASTPKVPISSAALANITTRLQHAHAALDACLHCGA